MRILVTGATGYVGGRLVPRLVDSGHQVRCLVRDGSSLPGSISDIAERRTGDADVPDDVAAAARDCDVAYFLIHSLGTEDFRERDRRMAEHFRAGCERAGVERIVYLGGLGDDDEEGLSTHLASRQEVGRTLSAGPVPVTEIRAAIIIGSGSASFEMLRSLTEALPIMVVPAWAHRTKCQPVDIESVLLALERAIGRTEGGHEILELGGPDILTYQEMMEGYAAVAGLVTRRILPVPVLSPRLSAAWVSLVSPLPGDLARDLIDSLVNDVVVKQRSAAEELDIHPPSFHEAVRRAIAMIGDLRMPTHWSHDALDRMAATPEPDDPSWAGGLILEDDRTEQSSADPQSLYRIVTGIGGQRGWFWGDWMWSIRGFIDQVMGGVGTRRGRRHPDELIIGDPLDFWRVDALEPPNLVRLRAEMWTPGTAWLEWRIEGKRGHSTIRQRARFVPRGLFGRLYWYVLVPFHNALFPRLLQRIVERAESLDEQPGERDRFV